MRTSAEEMIDELTRLYQNIFNLLEGFSVASISGNEDVTVNQVNKDGSVSTVTVNSFQKLQQELTRIDNNYRSLISADRLSYTVDANGNISQQTKTSFINAEYFDNITAGEQCNVDQENIMHKLVFPSVKLPFYLNTSLTDKIRCRIYEITGGYDTIEDNPSILDLEYALSKGTVTASDQEILLDHERSRVQYYGKFTIISVTQESTNNFSVVLDGVKYGGLSVIGSAINLKAGDFIVSASGATKYLVNDVNTFRNKVTLQRVGGSENLANGGTLKYNETIADDNVSVGVPVKPQQKLVIFFSDQNLKHISFPSAGIKINTSEYTVKDTKGDEYTLDEYFSEYVTNFSDYLQAFVTESNIPYSLGIKPDRPELASENFKIVQINKHVTDKKTAAEIANLQERKEQINTEIELANKRIRETENAINTKKYRTADDRDSMQEKVVSLRSSIQTLNQNLLTVSRSIDENATRYGLKDTKPKYRCIGFWTLQNPIFSPKTAKQYIIKYHVQYRYLSKNSDTVESTNYTMKSNGEEITVVFSPWNDLPTKTLVKETDESGNTVWETPAADSADAININQCSIPISHNESLEIRIRAMSEAGYPLSPMFSEWSEIMRINFPQDLAENNVNSTVAKNGTDLMNAEFLNILQNYGLTTHISKTLREGEKIFYHLADDIASGMFTDEQKNIAQSEINKLFSQRLAALENAATDESVQIIVRDFNKQTFVMSNNYVHSMFAGNYVDDAGVLETDKWGTIVRKTAYIVIRNNNNIPIEMRTLVPSVKFDSTTAPQYYNVPFVNENKYTQDTKQILYFRNIDVTGKDEEIFKLIKPREGDAVTQPLESDIDAAAGDENKNIVYYDQADELVKICKLNDAYSENFNAFTVENPNHDHNNMQNAGILTEFERMKLYTDLMQDSVVQAETAPEDTQGLGFDDNDFYAVGKNTCGSFFYPSVANINSITVQGNSNVATLNIPKNSEIIVPLIFEYRMIDRLGNVSGIREYDNTQPLEFSKTIGIDMLINGSIFKFDLKAVARLKSQKKVGNSLDVNSLLTEYTNENKEPLS